MQKNSVNLNLNLVQGGTDLLKYLNFTCNGGRAGSFSRYQLVLVLTNLT